MDEYKTEKAVYSPNDFVLWEANSMFESAHREVSRSKFYQGTPGTVVEA